MAIDDKDVAQRAPLYDAIDTLAEKLDAERKAILAVHAHLTEALETATSAKDYVAAADACLRIADVFFARNRPGEARQWQQRAADYADAGRRQKRAKKGRRR